jgi:hypothetical protein
MVMFDAKALALPMLLYAAWHFMRKQQTDALPF